MDLSCLILEAFKNSIEANAKNIKILVDAKEREVSIRIEDDGSGILVDNPFKKGVTTKGNNRGLGLTYIKENSISYSLSRDKEWTVLEFKSYPDDSLIKIEELLFPIFQSDGNISFLLKKGGNSILNLTSNELEDLDLKPISIYQIAKFKAYIKGIGVEKWQSSH